MKDRKQLSGTGDRLVEVEFIVFFHSSKKHSYKFFPIVDHRVPEAIVLMNLGHLTNAFRAHIERRYSPDFLNIIGSISLAIIEQV